MFCLSRKTVIGIAAVLAAIAVIAWMQTSGLTGRLWSEVAYVNPARGVRIIPPYPEVPWNPGAIKESPMGKLLARFMIDRSDIAFHIGVGPVMTKPPELPFGRFLAAIETAVTRVPHMHADVEGIEEDEDEHEEHEHAHHGEATRLQSLVAAHRVEKYIKWAYSLDPTRHDALELYCGFVRPTDTDQVPYTDDFGNKRELPRQAKRGILLARYSLERAKEEMNKPVPDIPVASALNLITLQVLETQGDWKLPPSEKIKRYSWLVEHMEYYLKLADLMEDEAKAIGWWQRRPQALQEEYATSRASAGAYLKMFKEALQRERAK